MCDSSSYAECLNGKVFPEPLQICPRNDSVQDNDSVQKECPLTFAIGEVTFHDILLQIFEMIGIFGAVFPSLR